MTPQHFGTDGVRGVFGQPPLDRTNVQQLGLVLAAELVATFGGSPRVVLGGDTRASTPWLSRWLAHSLEEGGVEVQFAGVIPTPGIAQLTVALGAHAGVAVSASHNPFPDNGIKLVDHLGFKWDPAREAALEERWAAATWSPDGDGRELVADPLLPSTYLRSLAPLVEGSPLAGLSIALDCAHGAASAFAENVFRSAGARVEALGNRPTGSNINLDCGSTHPETLAARVPQGFALGLAFDGDADRAILIDERGTVRDGDAMLYLWARALKEAGRLSPPRIVATSMSNLGLERALRGQGITVERCGVGDREVVARLRQQGLLLGGEQSGHLVHLGMATTGDGLMTGLVLARIVAESGRTVSELLADFERFPQVLINVPVARKPRFETLPTVLAAAREAEARLGEDGRLVLRYSGTEPLARVMIEGPEQVLIDSLAQTLAAEIRRTLA